MRRAGLWSVVFALLVLYTAPWALAEEEGGSSGYLVVHYDHVEPSKVTEYEANGKRWVEAFTEKEMSAEWNWWAYSRPDFTYAYVFSVPDYAYFDGQEERDRLMAEILGEEKMGELMAGAGAVRSHYNEILQPVKELSYQGTAAPSKVTFLRAGTHHVKPAMTKQFKELVQRVVAAFEKEEAPLGFNGYEVKFGRGSYTFVTLAEDAVQFYSQPGTGAVLAAAEGKEAAQEIYQEWRDCLESYEISDWQYREDLSYRPGDVAGEAAAEDGD